jgi:hypothetical protein
MYSEYRQNVDGTWGYIRICEQTCSMQQMVGTSTEGRDVCVYVRMHVREENVNFSFRRF